MADAIVGTLVGGRYRVQQLLGSGGSASIYEAEDVTLGRTVALKIPHDNILPDSVPAKRLVREARASGTVGHPNVCEVSELGMLPNGTPFVVMERLRGQTLRDRISQEGAMRFGDIVDVMMQVLSALGAAHARGIVHRDIKPENIFLVERAGCPALVKVLDFGCVTDVLPRRGHSREELTATGMVIGTPWYLAPEALRGVRDFDPRLDIYACGIILYEMTTGRRPYDAPVVNELFQQILAGFPPQITSLRPDTPRVLATIISRAMSIEAAARFESASAFQRALAQVPAGRATASGIVSSAALDLANANIEETRADPGSKRSPSLVDLDVDDDVTPDDDWDQPTLRTRPRKF